jgi:hypothetical protein
VIGIIMLPRKLQVIPQLQRLTGKILRVKRFDDSDAQEIMMYCAPVGIIGEWGCGRQGQMSQGVVEALIS